jgi:hypothetical protein
VAFNRGERLVKAPDKPTVKLPARVRWLSGIHIVLALALLAVMPLAFASLCGGLFFSRHFEQVPHGYPGGIAGVLDKYFLATPYQASYAPGWVLGLLPGLWLGFAAWGMLKQRAWGRQLAIAFHGAAAATALAAIAWSVCVWAALMRSPHGGASRGPDPGDMHPLLLIVLFVLAGAAVLVVLVTAAGLLAWLLRPATRMCFTAVGGRRTRTIVACLVGVAIGLAAVELAWNRASVYRGTAVHQGKTTGEWLALLASRDWSTRRAAAAELRTNPEALPVLREIFCEDSRHRAYRSRAQYAVGWCELARTWEIVSQRK